MQAASASGAAPGGGVDTTPLSTTIVADDEEALDHVVAESDRDRRRMRWDLTAPRNRPYLVAGAMLATGLVAAVVIYLTAAAAPDELLELSADTSKKYLRDLQLYGGTANVLAVELMTWFEGLWHGRPLAFTVAAITVVVCLGYLFFAVRLPPDGGEDGGGGDTPGPHPPG